MVHLSANWEEKNSGPNWLNVQSGPHKCATFERYVWFEPAKGMVGVAWPVPRPMQRQRGSPYAYRTSWRYSPHSSDQSRYASEFHYAQHWVNHRSIPFRVAGLGASHVLNNVARKNGITALGEPQVQPIQDILFWEPPSVSYGVGPCFCP